MLSWSSNALAIWCKEPTHWKRPWCWERLRAGREGDNRGWDGWMASLIQWTWAWASSGRWWRTGKVGMLQYMGLQRSGHSLATEQQQTFGGEGWALVLLHCPVIVHGPSLRMRHDFERGVFFQPKASSKGGLCWELPAATITGVTRLFTAAWRIVMQAWLICCLTEEIWGPWSQRRVSLERPNKS